MKQFFEKYYILLLAFSLFILSIISFVLTLFYPFYYWPFPVMIVSSLFSILLFIFSFLRFVKFFKAVSIFGFIANLVCFLPFLALSIYSLTMSSHLDYLTKKSEAKIKQKYDDPILFVTNLDSSNYYVSIDTYTDLNEKHYDDAGYLKTKILETKFEKVDYAIQDYSNHKYFSYSLSVHNTNVRLTVIDNGFAILRAGVIGWFIYPVTYFNEVISYYSFDVDEFESSYLTAKSIVELDA